MEKCANCGGEGLIHQGESIKYTCSVCMGTGKVVELGDMTASEDVADIGEVTATEESFLGDSSSVSSDTLEE